MTGISGNRGIHAVDLGKTDSNHVACHGVTPGNDTWNMRIP